MNPSLGRIVHYTLTDTDATWINTRRNEARVSPYADGNASAAVQGNWVQAGDVYPLVITRVWADPKYVTEDTAINGQVLLDGNDTLWVTSVQQGTDRRQWFEPPRV